MEYHFYLKEPPRGKLIVITWIPGRHFLKDEQSGSANFTEEKTVFAANDKTGAFG